MNLFFYWFDSILSEKQQILINLPGTEFMIPTSTKFSTTGFPAKGSEQILRSFI